MANAPRRGQQRGAMIINWIKERILIYKTKIFIKNIKPASGEFLDNHCSLFALHREIYDGNCNNKPNSHCVFNKDEDRWEESDDHLRVRFHDYINRK
jgi:hypothetical protein